MCKSFPDLKRGVVIYRPVSPREMHRLTAKPNRSSSSAVIAVPPYVRPASVLLVRDTGNSFLTRHAGSLCTTPSYMLLKLLVLVVPVISYQSVIVCRDSVCIQDRLYVWLISPSSVCMPSATAVTVRHFAWDVPSSAIFWIDVAAMREIL